MQKRFKTKEEFIRDYGENWENVIQFGWDSSMDNLFGKPSNDPEASRWSISNNMLTDESLVSKNYSLLDEAKKRYSIGTKFLNAKTNESLPSYKIEISEFEFFKHSGNFSTDVAIIPKKGEGLVYWNGKWAEIISDDKDEILAEAKRRFPIGCKFICLVTTGEYTLPKDAYFKIDAEGSIYSYTGISSIFHKHYDKSNNQWAKIVVESSTTNITSGSSITTGEKSFKVGDYVYLDINIPIERECEKGWIKDDRLEYNKTYEVREISGKTIKLKNSSCGYWHESKYFKLWDGKVEPLSNFNGIKVGDYVTCQTWGNQAYKVAKITSNTGFIIEFGEVGDKARQSYDSMLTKFEVISPLRGTIDNQDILNFEVSKPEVNKTIITNNLIITNQKQIKNGEQINGIVIIKKNRKTATIRVGPELREKSVSSPKRRATIVWVNPSNTAIRF